MKTTRVLSCALAAAALLLCAMPAAAGDAPQWMHALTSRPIPPVDDKTNAVLLYSETSVNVISADKIKTTERRVYKILRPAGRDFGDVWVSYNSSMKVNSLHGWCIPAQGKDYEVKDKDAADISLPKIAGSELVSDVKAKYLRIPAPDPGNIVGYEYEIEEHPMVLQDTWPIQESIPSLKRDYYLQLPPGWEYKATWMNTSEIKPEQVNGQWHWSVADQKGIRAEESMPPMRGLAGEMVVSFLAPGGSGNNGFSNWQQMGTWYRGLVAGRTDATPEIKQKAAELTGSAQNPVAKMRAIGRFVQHDIRYVAIELGIGGFQPHPARDVFTNHYGDCKDKVTLMASMLHEIGIDSYYFLINSERGNVGPDSPAHNAFDHVIIAIPLPSEMTDASLTATIQHPKLGRLLLFDPTDDLTPFGKISGALQASYGLLVTPDGGELVRAPVQTPSLNGIQRSGSLTLDANGNLKGDVKELRVGEPAWSQRFAQHNVALQQEKIKPIESLLAGSLSTFQITKAYIVNQDLTDQPFGFNYSFEAQNYAKSAAGLLLVRPRVLGSKSSGILETKDPRQFAIEFDAPRRDTDQFDIALPAGYEVDELPPPVDAVFSFGSYHSRTEVKGNSISYTRTFEVTELSVPVSKADELKKFYRIIYTDERNTAVLKPKQ